MQGPRLRRRPGGKSTAGAGGKHGVPAAAGPGRERGAARSGAERGPAAFVRAAPAVESLWESRVGALGGLCPRPASSLTWPMSFVRSRLVRGRFLPCAGAAGVFAASFFLPHLRRAEAGAGARRSPRLCVRGGHGPRRRATCCGGGRRGPARPAPVRTAEQSRAEPPARDSSAGRPPPPPPAPFPAAQ